MCKFASAIISHKTGKVKVADLTSHSNTYEYFKLTDTPRSEWREMHYLPTGKIECRTIKGDKLSSDQLENYVHTGWPTFHDFVAWAMTEVSVKINPNNFIVADHALPAGLTTIGGDCDLRGYSHALPAGLTTIGGYCYLRGYSHALPAGLTANGIIR